MHAPSIGEPRRLSAPPPPPLSARCAAVVIMSLRTCVPGRLKAVPRSCRHVACLIIIALRYSWSHLCEGGPRQLGAARGIQQV